jgi:hypothetical protein
MAKSRSKRTPYVVFGDDPDAPLCVELRRVIHPLVALIDGLPLLIPNKGRDKGRAYIRVVDAIAWHEKELKESRGRSGSRETVALLREALDSHRAEAGPPVPFDPGPLTRIAVRAAVEVRAEVEGAG